MPDLVILRQCLPRQAEVRRSGQFFYGFLQFEGGFTSVSIYWNENKVLYTLQLSYGAEDTAAAEALITEWMNAF